MLKKKVTLIELSREVLQHRSETISLRKVQTYVAQCSVVMRLFRINLTARKDIHKIQEINKSLNALKNADAKRETACPNFRQLYDLYKCKMKKLK